MTLKGRAARRSAAPPAPAPAYLWRSGELLPWEEATIHITGMAWASLSAVFEGIRGYWNEEEQELYVFRLQSHLDRLFNSMKLVRMSAPYSQDELVSAIIDLLRANRAREDTYIMPVAYFSGDVAGYRAAHEQPGAVFVTARPGASNLDGNRGSHCCVSSWTRISDNVLPPRAKMLSNYENSRLVSTEARINGYDAGIILNPQGKVSEGSYACIFIVRDGVAITPGVTSGILESITRETVIQLFSERLGVPVVEREVDRTELYIADEVFLCGTYAEIEPVVSVDRHAVGSGRPGPLTRKVRRLYKDLVRGKDKSMPHWRLPVWRGHSAE